MIFRKHKFALFALALLTAPFVPRETETPTAPGTPTVKRVRVRAGVLESTLRLSGSISTVDSITLRAPRLPGRRGPSGGSTFSLTLQKLTRPGSHVSKGDVVAEFDVQYMQVRLDDQIAGVQQQENSLRRLQADLRVKLSAHRQSIRAAKAALDKAALDLKTISVRSAIQAEAMRLVHEEARARYQMLLKEQPLVEISERAALRMSELEVADDQIEVKRAQGNLERLKVTAPISGVVIPQPIRRGTEMAEVAVGDELRFGQPYVNIVDTSELVVEALANQIDVDQLRIGQRARVHIDALPGLVFDAKVTFMLSGGWQPVPSRLCPPSAGSPASGRDRSADFPQRLRQCRHCDRIHGSAGDCSQACGI
jgi:multidrug efflux pump subunit AcrA (membrane-fusion protein)